MRFPFTLLLFILLASWAGAQTTSLNLPANGSDTARACTGNLYDNGGPSGNYSNNVNGSVYLKPPGGGTVDLTFTSFSMESCCDRLRIYSITNGQQTQVNSFTGNNLPNGGSPLSVSGDEIRIRLTSDYSVTRSGFALNWSAGGSTNPQAQFSLSDDTVAFGSPVQLSSTGSGGGSYTWVFGDGDSLVENQGQANHSYTSAGTYSVYMIQENCFGRDSASPQSVTVHPPPAIQWQPDSVTGTVDCGVTFRDTLDLLNTGNGALQYQVSGRLSNLFNQVIFEEGFENGLGQFSPQPATSSGLNLTQGSGALTPSGNYHLNISGYSNVGYVANLNQVTPDEFSFYFNSNNSFSSDAFVSLSTASGGLGNEMVRLELDRGGLRVRHATGILNFFASPGDWHFVELRNIDFQAQTFDVYLNGVLRAAGLGFRQNSVTNLSKLEISSTGSNFVYLDEFKLNSGVDIDSSLTFLPSSGSINAGDSTQVGLEYKTTGKSAGVYTSNILIETNVPGADSAVSIPLVLTIQGSPQLNLSPATVDFDSTISGVSYADSVLVTNPSCVPLNFSNIFTNGNAFSVSSSLSIPPYDSAFLSVNHTAGNLGLQEDTIFLRGNLDTAIALRANVQGAPSIAMDSAQYNVTSVGCRDSVPFQFQIFNEGQADLDWSLSAGRTYGDDFESGLNPDLWQASSTALVSNHCFVNSGSQSLSWINGPREITTQALNLNQGDSVTFWASSGNTGSPCETPDGGNEDLRLQYRTPNSSWTTFLTVSNTNGMQRFGAAIPQSNAQMELRFIQLSYSGSTYDHWFVDDFRIGSSSAPSNFQPDTGTTAQNDSVTVSGYWDVSNLTTGSYSRELVISSNDVQHPDTSISVQITVLGEPQLSTPLQSGCMSFGSLAAGSTTQDSLLIVNTGCDSLSFSSLSLLGSNSPYQIPSALPTLASEDSLMLPITFAPSRTQTGSLPDTLLIANSDTAYRLCLQGTATPSPQLLLQPDSLSIQVSNCGDSITVPVSVQNTGADTLNFHFLTDSLLSQGAINVTVFDRGVNFSTRNNIQDVLQQNPAINLTFSSPLQPTGMQADLQNADVLIIPDIASFYWNNFGTVFKNFRDQGNSIIVLGETSSSAMNSSGLVPSNGVFSSTGSTAIDLPNHPIVAGINGPLPYVNNQYTLRYTGTANVSLIAGSIFSSRALISELNGISGKQIYLGYNFNDTSSASAQILRQAVSYGATAGSQSLQLSAQVSSGNVPSGDSTTVDITLSTAALLNGTYDFSIPVATNDPEATPALLPVHLVVNGSALAELANTGCRNLGNLLQGEKGQDTAFIVNRGCDTLQINGMQVGQGVVSRDTSVGSLVVPGDTLGVPFTLSTSAVGAYSDTIQVLTSDTTLQVCVTATINGAPILDLPQDSVYHRINKCKVIGNGSFKLSNTGLDTLLYQVKIGEYSGSNRETYSTSGATTTHQFSGLPTSADSIIVEIITYGNYNGYFSRPSLRMDNSFQGTITNFNQDFVEDTVLRTFTGTTINNWLSDGSLTVSLVNSSNVSGAPGSFHKVNLRVKQNVNWVSVTGATSGTITPGNSATKNLVFNAALLSVGRYRTNLSFPSNSGNGALNNLPVVLEVVSEPEVALSDTCLVFNLTEVGDTAAKKVTVYNNGCQPLNVSNIFSGGGSFSVSPGNGNIPVDDSLEVTVNFIPTSRGNFNSTVFINNSDTNRSVCLQGAAEALPIADFTINPENICLGEISVQNNAQNFNSLFWTFGDGNNSSQPNPQHSYQQPGTYQITLRATNALGSDTLTKSTTVNPLLPDFIPRQDTALVGDTVQFVDSTNSATSWNWDFGDGNSSTQQNPSHVYTGIGLFNVRLTVTDSRACTQSISYPIIIEDDVSLSEWALQHELSLFPNPTSQYAYLEASNLDWRDHQIQIFNGLGQLVRNIAPSQDSEQLRIATGKLAPGLYRINILEHQERKASLKLIVR